LTGSYRQPRLFTMSVILCDNRMVCSTSRTTGLLGRHKLKFGRMCKYSLKPTSLTSLGKDYGLAELPSVIRCLENIPGGLTRINESENNPLSSSTSTRMYASVTMGINLPSVPSYPITLSKARLVVRIATMAVEVRRLSVDMLEIPLSVNPD
ncbi:hypothetical protein KCU62_g9, partial [Aureobasidium sp. EXF-3399]